MLADCTEQLGNFVKVLDCLLQGAKADHASFTVQPSVAVLRYAQACATIKVLVQNKVFRCAEHHRLHFLAETVQSCSSGLHTVAYATAHLVENVCTLTCTLY